jgi:thioredoxin-related protein
MKPKALVLFYLILFVTVNVGFAQGKAKKKTDSVEAVTAINWITFSEAVERCKKEPRKIIIDVFTDWCGWCKHMDATTFKNPVVTSYISQKYYAVKLNAEMHDTIVFNNTTFVNPVNGGRGTHQLASALLNNKLSYPTTVYLDEKMDMLSPVPGYQDAPTMEMILNYFGEESYKTIKWEDFQKSFVGHAKPPTK